MPKVWFGRWWLGLMAGCLVAAAAQAQADAGTHHVLAQPVVAPEIVAVVGELSSRAAVIFAGEVVAVVRDTGAGVVEVRFRVDVPVRACAAGTYTLREWSGRWVGRPDRYRVGEHRLMLLTAAGTAGLSSPVGGSAGTILLRGNASAPVMTAGTIAPDQATIAPELTADLRSLATRVVRQLVAQPVVVLGAAVASSGAVPVAVAPWGGAVTPLRTDGSDGTTLEPPLSMVLAMLQPQSGAADAQR